MFLVICLSSSVTVVVVVVHPLCSVRPSRRSWSSSVVIVRRRPSKYYLQDVAEASLGRLAGLCGPQHIQNYLNKWKMSKTYLVVFGLISQSRACNVSVVASGVFFTSANHFLAPKLSGEARGAQHLCIFGKKDSWKYIYIWVFWMCFVL